MSAIQDTKLDKSVPPATDRGRYPTACPSCDAIIGPERKPGPDDLGQCPRCLVMLQFDGQIWSRAGDEIMEYGT